MESSIIVLEGWPDGTLGRGVGGGDLVVYGTLM